MEGFLSKLGAEGNGAHVLIAWNGKPGVGVWKQAGTLQLSSKPHQSQNIAMAGYPYSKLLVGNKAVFMLQVYDPANQSIPVYESIRNATALLSVDQLTICNGAIRRSPVALIRWPVKRAMDFLCQTYGREAFATVFMCIHM